MGSTSYKRLLDEINSMGAIDIHSHIDAAHPAARGPEEILLYHYIATELRSAGLPLELLSPQRITDMIPYLRAIRNTTTFWCLMKILRDIYEFDEGLTEANYPVLRDRISEQAGRKGRAESILRERGLMKRTFLTFDCAKPPPAHDAALFIGALRIEPLIGRLNPSSLKDLATAIGQDIEGLEEFEGALALLFERFKGCAAVTASFLPGEIFVKAEKGRAEEAFRRLASGSEIAPEERMALTSYALEAVLREAEGNGVPFQMMVGVERPVPGASPPDFAVLAYEPRFVVSYCRVFHEFKDVKFDIFLANRIQSHELAVVAKNYPNVSVSGYWWYNLSPTIIREILRERLQILPANKMNGFFSDAYVAEWSYGKACLIRSQMAHVLADMVDEGFYSMDVARELAADLLERNPTDLYRLTG
jgi:glucuronate isomerase